MESIAAVVVVILPEAVALIEEAVAPIVESNTPLSVSIPSSLF